MQNLDQQIGGRLQQARKKAGFRSARSFARQYTIPESTYSQHETGKRSLSPKMVMFYSEVLNVKPGWLISGEMESAQVVEKLLPVDQAILQRALTQALEQMGGQDVSRNVENIVNYCTNVYLKLQQMQQEEAV